MTQIGSVTVVVETERGTILGWAASFAQGKQLINWLVKDSEQERP